MAARRAPHRLCLGCEQTCRAQVCKQCVELRDAILGACCICDCRGYARICGTGGPLRPGGADRPLRSVAADKTLRTGRTGRPLRSGRAGCTDCTSGALQPLHTLRPRGTDRTGYTLDPLYALRPRRPLHILRREDRRERHRTRCGTGRRATRLCAAARILKTIHQNTLLLKLGAGKLLRFILCAPDEEVSARECARFVNNWEKTCNRWGGMLTYYNMFSNRRMSCRRNCLSQSLWYW